LITFKNKLFEKELADAFEIYLRTGGFPLAIKEFLTRGKMWNAYKAYIDWIKTDIIRAGKVRKPQKR